MMLTAAEVRRLWPDPSWLLRRLALWFLESVPNVSGSAEVRRRIGLGSAGMSPEEESQLVEELGRWWIGYGSPEPPPAYVEEEVCHDSEG